MATRVNLCTNPCLTNDATGWGGNGTPTRTDVTVLGFARQWAARYLAGSYITTPTGAASAGLAYTVSVYLRPQTFTLNGTVWIEFLDGGGGSVGTANSGFSAPAGNITRISQTSTAPSGTASCWLVVTGENYAVNTTDYTMCLIEQAASLGSYFDGGSPGASWNGTPGNSPSTLADAPDRAPHFTGQYAGFF
ncbi:hypothetical protein ACNF49_14110 [Actinomadura sp. ATCC 39365]